MEFDYYSIIQFLLCVIDIFSKYTWVINLKNIKDITITDIFQKILDKFGGKPKKMQEDNGSEFCNKLMQTLLEDSHMKICSARNEGNLLFLKDLLKF